MLRSLPSVIRGWKEDLRTLWPYILLFLAVAWIIGIVAMGFEADFRN